MISLGMDKIREIKFRDSNITAIYLGSICIYGGIAKSARKLMKRRLEAIRGMDISKYSPEVIKKIESTLERAVKVYNDPSATPKELGKTLRELRALLDLSLIHI